MTSAWCACVIEDQEVADDDDDGQVAACEPETKPDPVDALPELVRKDGTYATVPLEKESIVLKVVQSSAVPLGGPGQVAAGIQANLAHMVELGEQACSQGDKPDILLYHEFPLTGYFTGSRADKLNAALTVPGVETQALGELAKSCDSYLVFGAYVKDAEWPGHVLSVSTIIGRDGQVAKKVWKPRNIKRFYSTFEITTTTVESVRTKFRQKYGVEEELPVLRTEFGNLAVSSAQLDPLVFAALAMQGAEIVLRTSTLYFESDVASTALNNNVYSAMANITHPSKYGGRSVIVNPMGEVMDRVDENMAEGIASARIPIGEFRKNRRIPQFTTEFTQTVFEQYQAEIPLDHLDLPESELPQNGEQMKGLFEQISRWLNP